MALSFTILLQFRINFLPLHFIFLSYASLSLSQEKLNDLLSFYNAAGIHDLMFMHISARRLQFLHIYSSQVLYIYMNNCVVHHL